MKAFKGYKYLLMKEKKKSKVQKLTFIYFIFSDSNF